ncbi:hypothetical protein [Streptomyces sp. NPDC057877]|uniref:hypothetical protein n=1 Tax=Streptomyces sp. NPDC057877 TaxID=3346269 RepID=UPI00368C5D5B
MEPRPTSRLLPWSGPEDKPCYLITDDGGHSALSRLADATESIQLGMARDLVTHARALLPDIPPSDVRSLAAHLTTALHDALRIAESRGHRLNRSN